MYTGGTTSNIQQHCINHYNFWITKSVILEKFIHYYQSTVNQAEMSIEYQLN